VPNGEYAIATRALDNGALGIVMPHVDSADEAREVVNRLEKPPVGHRSMGGIGPHYGAALRQLRRGRDRPQCRQFD
jgi:2-keto-3-deoxy-L-rhamnonate aldolase RhmA